MMEKPRPAYRIHTARLVLRCWEPEDAETLKSAIDDSLEHLRPWMPWVKNEPESVDAKAQRLRTFRGHFDLDREYVYGVFDAGETGVYGSSGLHRRGGHGSLEVGYWLRPDVTRRGLGTEVAAALTKAAFEINRANRVGIHCDTANVPSASIARKLGFVQEGTLRQRMRRGDGALRDEMVWTLLADEYPLSPAAKTAIEAYDVLGRRLL